MRKLPVDICFFALCLGEIQAQDMHFALPNNALQYHSPALAGASGKFGFTATWRDQWNAAGAPYKTRMVLADRSFGNPRYNKMNFSVGGYAYKDETGLGSLGSSGFCIQLASSIKTGNKTMLSGGMGMGFVQLSRVADQLSWQSQYNGRTYDPDLPSGEVAQNLTRSYADIQTGFSFVYDERNILPPQRASRFIIAYGLNHVNSPYISAVGASDKLLPKHSLVFTGHLKAKNNLAFKPCFIGLMQGPMTEISGGMLLNYMLGEGSHFTGINKGNSISLGGVYRLKDALIPVIEFEHGYWALSVSYEVNNSGLSRATNYRGGYEIALRYQAGRQMVNTR